MKLKTLIKMLLGGHIGNYAMLMKTSKEFYRACFVSAAISSGIYDRLACGPAGLDELLAVLGPDASSEGLAAWLKIGVRLRELKAGRKGYSLRGRFSRKMARPQSDPFRALLEEMITLQHEYISQAPFVISQGKKFDFDESYGEIVARASRVAEPLVFEVVDTVVPASGPCRLLEVGCGSGVYIKRACERNSELTAVGLELQPEVARFAEQNIISWGLRERVEILAKDIREYEAGPEFDLVTLLNNIYYFPVEERAKLLRILIGFIKPGGRLVVSTSCQNGRHFIEFINMWATLTEGTGALPTPGQMRRLLEEAGFENISGKNIVPLDSFWMFLAGKPSSDQTGGSG